MLRNVYFSFVYSHLQYGVSTWGHFAAKYINKIQVQQNNIVKLIRKPSFFKTKLNPLYHQKLNLLNLGNIYQLEISKLMSKYQNNSLPNCSNDFFALPFKLHSHQTRFETSDNYFMALRFQLFPDFQLPVKREIFKKLPGNPRKLTGSVKSLGFAGYYR